MRCIAFLVNPKLKEASIMHKKYFYPPEGKHKICRFKTVMKKNLRSHVCFLEFGLCLKNPQSKIFYS